MSALTAGASLLTDYILTLAVSISSDVAQITSAIPELYEWRVELALVLIAIITIINLRGVKESGTVFVIPTYFFVAMFALMLGIGYWQQSMGTLGAVTSTEVYAETTQALTISLILKAFASGCTALTGVEAISNTSSMKTHWLTARWNLSLLQRRIPTDPRQSPAHSIHSCALV